MKHLTCLPILLVLGLILGMSPTSVIAQVKEPVTVQTFVRAESDVAIAKVADAAGFGTFLHLRGPAPLDKQTVIRMNRDTIYSTAVLDLAEPVFVTLPDASGRYMSLHVLSQDHYSYVLSDPGRYEINQDKVGTRFAYLIVRTFMDPNDPEDIAAANAAQDGLLLEGGGDGPFDAPDWDLDQLATARGALNTLAKLGGDASGAFGTKEETDPIQHLVNAAGGWGGLPEQSAFYEIQTPADNDGTPHTVTVKDVPVDGFWSITVYNADGFISENDMGVYSYNNVTAEANEDGSVTINFGGCEDGRVNCLPVSQGWNYAARMYQPHAEILNGSWKFPAVKPAE
jgi:hypothetical protein